MDSRFKIQDSRFRIRDSGFGIRISGFAASVVRPWLCGSRGALAPPRHPPLAARIPDFRQPTADVRCAAVGSRSSVVGRPRWPGSCGAKGGHGAGEGGRGGGDGGVCCTPPRRGGASSPSEPRRNPDPETETRRRSPRGFFRDSGFGFRDSPVRRGGVRPGVRSGQSPQGPRAAKNLA